MDRLRAPAVSVIGGHITHFCSSTCRENHLRRPSAPPEESRPSDASSVEKTEKPDGQTRSKGKQPAPSKEQNENPAAPRDTQSRLPPSPTLHYQGILTVGFLLLFVASMLVPPLLGGMLPVLLVGAGALFMAVISNLRNRAFGFAKLSENSSVPIASGVILLSSLLGTDPRTSSVSAAALLAANCLFRLLEIAGRYRSGVLANIENSGTRSVSSSWRDNSPMSAWIRRISIILEWARYPVACLVGILVYLAYSNAPLDAFYAGATALVALNPRMIRMCTGDAHLSSALAAAQRNIVIRDAHVLDNISRSRAALYMSRYSLINEHISVVDWKTRDDVDEKALLTALGSVQSAATGRIASAIVAFIQNRSQAPTPPPDELEVFKGKGIIGIGVFGRVVCGSRSLLLGEGISTAELESHAQTVESSGRRALFVSLNGQVASAFGIEETPITGAHETNMHLKSLGLNPMMFSSAEVDAAQALGSRIGIETVHFEKTEESLGDVLEQIKEMGENAILIGRGQTFEDNLQYAAAAIAIGGTESTQAGVDASSHDIAILPWIVEAAQRSRRSTEINLVAATASTIIGLALSVGWFSPYIVVFAGSCGFAVGTLSTFNGPYPMWERILYSLDSNAKKVKTIFTRLWQR